MKLQPIEAQSPVHRRPHKVFAAPFSTLDDAQLLKHFRSRTGVHYSPVPSPEETRPDRIEAVLENRFDLVGECHRLAEPPQWTINPSADRQWLIALHKFYWAVGLGMRHEATGDPKYAEKWISLTRSWMQQTPPLFVNSQTTGRRIQNWIYAYHYFVLHGEEGLVPPQFHRQFLLSLEEQVSGLCLQLDPARNHRTLELSAIFLAGVAFPEFANAARWRSFALAGLEENMRADLLPDGVQCELSTHYHCTVLKNYLNIRRLAAENAIEFPAHMDERIRAALQFAMHVHKPDGEIPVLSDGDAGDFRSLLRLGSALYGDSALLYAATAGESGEPPARRAVHFADSGYVVLRSGWGEVERYEDERYLVFDCGPLGEGDHGHLDCLSIEVAAYGRSLIVDPGRYTYQEQGAINWRARFRGTASHNTVLVDGCNQTKYAQGPKHKFTVQGPAPQAELCAFASEAGFDFVHGRAVSDEYDAVHERRIFFVAGEYWLIWDALTGQTQHLYEQRFQLAAEAQHETTILRSDGMLRVDGPGMIIASPPLTGAKLRIECSHVSRLYGEMQDAPAVIYSQTAQTADFPSVVFPWRPAKPELVIERLDAAAASQDDSNHLAGAVKVSINRPDAEATQDIFFFAPADKQMRRFGDWQCDGEWAWLRLDHLSRLVSLQMSPGATLQCLHGGCRP